MPADFTVRLRVVVRFIGCGCLYDLTGLQLVEPGDQMLDVDHDEPGMCPECCGGPDDGEVVAAE